MHDVGGIGRSIGFADVDEDVDVDVSGDDTMDDAWMNRAMERGIGADRCHRMT